MWVSRALATYLQIILNKKKCTIILEEREFKKKLREALYTYIYKISGSLYSSIPILFIYEKKNVLHYFYLTLFSIEKKLTNVFLVYTPTYFDKVEMIDIRHPIQFCWKLTFQKIKESNHWDYVRHEDLKELEESVSVIY